MVRTASLALQKRLACSLLKCGQRKVWLDPCKKHIIAQARSRESVRDLIAQNVIQSRPGYHGFKTRIDKVLNNNNSKLRQIYSNFKEKQESLLDEQAVPLEQ